MDKIFKMKKNEYVVLTVKGWDGSRILGLFSSIDEAKKVREEFLLSGGPDSNFQKEEFYLDIVELGNVSTACEIFMNCSTSENVTTRKHIYS